MNTHVTLSSDRNGGWMAWQSSETWPVVGMWSIYLTCVWALPASFVCRLFVACPPGEVVWIARIVVIVLVVFAMYMSYAVGTRLVCRTGEIDLLRKEVIVRSAPCSTVRMAIGDVERISVLYKNILWYTEVFVFVSVKKRWKWVLLIRWRCRGPLSVSQMGDVGEFVERMRLVVPCALIDLDKEGWRWQAFPW